MVLIKTLMNIDQIYSYLLKLKFALSTSSHEQTQQKNESAVFLYCKFSLFLKDPFFKIIYY